MKYFQSFKNQRIQTEAKEGVRLREVRRGAFMWKAIIVWDGLSKAAMEAAATNISQRASVRLSGGKTLCKH